MTTTRIYNIQHLFTLWSRGNPVRQHFPLGVEIRKGCSFLKVRVHRVVYRTESSVDASPRFLRHQYIHVRLLVDLVVPLVDSFATEFVLLSETVIRLTTQGHNAITTVFFFKQSGSPLVVSCVFCSYLFWETKGAFLLRIVASILV